MPGCQKIQYRQNAKIKYLSKTTMENFKDHNNKHGLRLRAFAV